MEAEECYIPAHILADSESILKTKEDADAFVDIEAVYDFGSYTYTIPKEELTKMAYVSSDGRSLSLVHFLYFCKPVPSFSPFIQLPDRQRLFSY